MKKLMTVFFIILFSANAFASGTKWFDGSFEDAKAKAAKEGKLILVHFYSPG